MVKALASYRYCVVRYEFKLLLLLLLSLGAVGKLDLVEVFRTPEAGVLHPREGEYAATPPPRDIVTDVAVAVVVFVLADKEEAFGVKRNFACSN